MVEKYNTIERYDDEEPGRDAYYSEIIDDIEKVVSFDELTTNQKHTILDKVCSSLIKRDDIFLSDEDEEKENYLDQVYLLDHENAVHFYIDCVEPWMKNNFSGGMENDKLLSEANRFYSASLIGIVNKTQEESGDETAEDLACLIRDRYFNVSDTIDDYIGGLSETIKLISLSKHCSVSRATFAGELSSSAIYNSSFCIDKELFVEPLKNKDPIELINILDAEFLLSISAAHEGYEQKFSSNVRLAFQDVIDNPETPPLVRIVAQQKLKNVGNINYDDSQFKSFCRVAPGVYIDRIGSQIKGIRDEAGNKEDVNKLSSDNKFGVNKKDILLIQVAHDPNTKKQLESELGIKIEAMSLDTQKYFLRFAIESNNARYKKLIDCLSVFDRDSEKIELINAFVSTQFGEDFGDSLLSIVEHTDSNKSLEILKIINEYREVSKKFGELYYDFDPELASSTELAMNERLTDLLVAAETVAKDGFLKEDVSPRRNSKGYQNDGRYNIEVHSIYEIIDIMQQFLKSQQIMQDILSDSSTQITKTNADSGDKLSLGSQTYRFANKEKGFMQLHVRRRGASRYDRYNEYGNAGGTEATISWLVDPINPYKLSALKDPDCISVRFDREGRLPDEKPDSEDRSPIREDGLISIDISSVLGGPEVAANLPVRLGRIIAAGNGIRSRLRGSESSLNHNKNYFDQKYGQADNFEKIVNYITEKMERTFKKPTQAQLAELAFNLFQKSKKINENTNRNEQYAS